LEWVRLLETAEKSKDDTMKAATVIEQVNCRNVKIQDGEAVPGEHGTNIDINGGQNPHFYGDGLTVIVYNVIHNHYHGKDEEKGG
jgi:hypothetical protein